MSKQDQPAGRWIAVVAVLVVVAALGWFLGSRMGGEEPESPTTAASSEPEVEIYRNIGARVVRIAPEQGSITLDHEEIEGFMSAMIMDLRVADRAELEGLEPEQRILFDLARIDSTYQVVNIRPAPAEGETPEPGAVAEPVEPALGRGDLVPNLALITADGRHLQLHDLEPRHKVITFFYARCPLQTFCPTQSARLAQMQTYLEESGSDVHIVSLTLDAEHDGQQILAGYAARFGADPDRWTLAGGEDPEAIREFASQAGAQIHVHEDGSQIDHALIALRVDGNRIVDRVYGLSAIEKLLKQM